MARRVEIVLIDDLDGTQIPAGEGQTVCFRLDDTTYEIDLTPQNAAALRGTLAVYVNAGRRTRDSS